MKLEMGDVDTMRKLTWAPDQLSEVELQGCPNCRQVGFLTVQAVTITKDRKGKPQEKEEAIVSNLVLGAEGIARAINLAENPPDGKSSAEVETPPKSE